ncbi:receptor-transporting protein 3-like isoform X1 [Branchiostoma floridae x Branchiostoma belcheri]
MPRRPLKTRGDGLLSVDPSGPRWHGGTLPRTGHPPDRVSTCPAPRDCSSRARSYQVCYTLPSQGAAMKGQVELPLMKPSHGLPRGLNPVLGLPMSPPMSHQQAYGAPYYNTSMEAVWHGEFSKLFSQFYPHLWYLIPSPAAPSPRWYRFRDSAKVRFSCQQCGNGWTSMKGRVIFWYYLNPQGVPVPEGYLHFKLYGQQCKRCKNGRFEMAMWYPEEVVKVLGNVYNRVGQTYYGFYQPPLRQDRRPGKPRTQHNAELCQACKDGECTNAH